MQETTPSKDMDFRSSINLMQSGTSTNFKAVIISKEQQFVHSFKPGKHLQTLTAVEKERFIKKQAQGFSQSLLSSTSQFGCINPLEVHGLSKLELEMAVDLGGHIKHNLNFFVQKDQEEATEEGRPSSLS